MNTLHEVATAWRLDETMRDPIRWLTSQILTGKFRARKVGRNWLMTAADIEHNLERLANVTAEPAAPAPAVERPVGVPSLASMRRRRSA